MKKNVLRTFPAVSLLLFFFLACTIPSTYTRDNIEKTIEDICRNKFNVEVKAVLAGDTIWVYAPFKKLAAESGQWEEKTLEVIREIFHSLGRVSLSMDNPPKFYCLLASNIEKMGIDTYTIGFIPDLVKFDMGFISIKERDARIAFLSFANPQALGDTQGSHMQPYDIPPEEFAGYLAAH